MSEVETRRLPAVPDDARGFGDLLGRYMEVTEVSTDARALRPYLIVKGLLRADPAAPDPAALRRSFLDSLDAIMAILGAAGTRHHHHPELVMYGEAHEEDGEQRFTDIECLARISLYRAESR